MFRPILYVQISKLGDVSRRVHIFDGKYCYVQVIYVIE
jgi:hypothetical protein